MDIAPQLTAGGACYLYYSRASNTIQLANDAGSFGPSLTLGTSGFLQNGQCRIDSTTSTSSVSGNVLTLNLAMTFLSSGSKRIFMEVQNATLDSGWAQRGTWTVP
jgi:hypothetical protein